MLPLLLKTDPFVGAVIVDVGGVVSVEAVAGSEPGSRVAGCASMLRQIYHSLLHIRVRCSVGKERIIVGTIKPHDHCTVPAPKTRAPLGARYIVM